MPSRRSVLGASGTAAATALAGCSALSDPEGSPAEVRPGRDLRLDDGELVARAATDRIGCPRGDVELLAEAIEAPDGALRVRTRTDVFPGEEECDSDWRHGGIDVAHEWALADGETDAVVTDTASNVVYTDTDPGARLRNTSSTETGEWRVRRTAGTGSVEQYNFRSTLVGATTEPGDELAAVTVDVPLSKPGLLGGESETVTLTGTLGYGEHTRS